MTQRTPRTGSPATQRRRPLAKLVLALLVGALTLALAVPGLTSPAAAAPTNYLFWTDFNNAPNPPAGSVGYVGRAKVDGTSVEPNFVKPWNDNDFRSIAANDSFIYATTQSRFVDSEGRPGREAAIARLRTDGLDVGGSGFVDNFIVPRPGSDQPRLTGIAANRAGIYWSANSYDYGAPLGYAQLNGGGINTAFAGTGEFNAYHQKPAVNSSFLYFSVSKETATGFDSAIARTLLDGSKTNRSFIPGIRAASIAASDAHVFWVDFETGAIGRANADGTNVTRSLIPDAVPASFGAESTLVTDGTYLYWTNGGTINRATVQGTDVRQGFINTGRERLHGLTIGAADSTAAPQPDPPTPPPAQPQPTPTPAAPVAPATTVETPTPSPDTATPPSPPATKPTAVLPRVTAPRLTTLNRLRTGLTVHIAMLKPRTRAAIEVFLRSRKLVSKRMKLSATGTATAEVKLPRAALKRVRKGSKLTVRVRAARTDGQSVTIARTVRIK